MLAIFNNESKRYQSLILSIMAFLSLISLLLIFTFYTSGLLERNTRLMNETSRVANAAQAVIKDLFDLENSYGEDTSSPHIQTVLKRLKTNSDIIDNRLELIKNGGETTLEDGSTLTLSASNTEIAQESLKVAQEQWNQLNPKIQAYLSNADNVTVNSADALTQAATQAKTSSLRINESLDRLVQDTVRTAQTQANYIRFIQALGIIVILVYFGIFIFFFMRRLRESDAETEIARQETKEIMQTVNTGLFLLDQDLVVGNQYSAALEDILGTQKIAGENFIYLLKNRISDKDLQTTEDFINQLYRAHVKEKLVDSLNPLKKILFYANDGSAKSRYLDFKFARVYENKEITRILVNVNDVSEAVRLEQRLEKERAENNMQVEMLTTILNVNPQVINEFIDNTNNHINKVNNILKNPGSSQFELENKLKSIYREIHSLKGEASALRLHSFTNIAGDAEDKLYTLQNQGKLSGNDFLPLTVHLDELLSLSNTISSLGDRINNTNGGKLNKSSSNPDTFKPSTPIAQATLVDKDAPTQTLDDYLVKFGQDIAIRQHKNIDINVLRDQGITVPPSLSVIVKEICVQLIRNAIVHGIADTQTRLNHGKPEKGKVTIYFKQQTNEKENCFLFAVEDDGQGIDYQNIRQKLIDSGRYSTENVQKLTDPQLLNILFSSGFSTKATVDEDGGRGVGLDVVKDRVKEHGGKINVQSKQGEFSRFTVKLPIPKI